MKVFSLHIPKDVAMEIEYGEFKRLSKKCIIVNGFLLHKDAEIYNTFDEFESAAKEQKIRLIEEIEMYVDRRIAYIKKVIK